jgi:2-polyprenyl-3-methyl-5-hydroxy-6-metoxy-1,4-benzoquinol methylase
MAGGDFARRLVPHKIKNIFKNLSGITALQSQVADLQKHTAALEKRASDLEDHVDDLERRAAKSDDRPPGVSRMRLLWNKLSRESRLGFISHLQPGEEWDVEEFHLVGVRFVDRMIERFEKYGNHDLNSSSILEIGCGVGRFIRPLAERFENVCGIDISEEMIKAAREYCSDLDNVTVTTNDGSSLAEFAEASFDYCICAGVFQHITHIEVIIEYIKLEARRSFPVSICRQSDGSDRKREPGSENNSGRS